jgi:hypothetical protein
MPRARRVAPVLRFAPVLSSALTLTQIWMTKRLRASSGARAMRRRAKSPDASTLLTPRTRRLSARRAGLIERARWSFLKTPGRVVSCNV